MGEPTFRAHLTSNKRTPSAHAHTHTHTRQQAPITPRSTPRQVAHCAAARTRSRFTPRKGNRASKRTHTHLRTHYGQNSQPFGGSFCLPLQQAKRAALPYCASLQLVLRGRHKRKNLRLLRTRPIHTHMGGRRGGGLQLHLLQAPSFPSHFDFPLALAHSARGGGLERYRRCRCDVRDRRQQTGDKGSTTIGR